jgi:hypothetical protein
MRTSGSLRFPEAATLSKGSLMGFSKNRNRQLFNKKITSEKYNRRFFDLSTNWNGQLFPRIEHTKNQNITGGSLKTQISTQHWYKAQGLMMKWKEQTIEKMGFTFHTTSYIIIPLFVFMNNNGVVLNIEALP